MSARPSRIGSPTTRPVTPWVTRVGTAPLGLLEAVAGLELVELPDATECCGFGGTFAVKNADTSSAMVIDKCRAIESTGAEVCTAVDGSCLLQIGGRLSRERAGARTLHLTEILASQEPVTRPFPAAAHERSPTGSCARTCATRPRRSRQTRAGSWPSSPTGRSSAKRAGRSRPTWSRSSTGTGAVRVAVTAAGGRVHWAPTRRRRT